MKGTVGLMGRALRTLALVGLLCLAVFVVASRSPAVLGLYREPEQSVAPAAAALEVLPDVGSVGTMFSITGSGFQAAEVVTLTIDGPDTYSGASTLTADSEGAFVLFWDSSHEPYGSYALAASGGATSTAEASWDVRPGVLCGESDGFDAPALDPAWSWLREDETHWSLSEQPGALRIQTQAGTLTGVANDQQNVLLRPAPSGNYRVTVQVEVHADQDYQHAGLYLYQDDDHYVRLARGQSTQGIGQGVGFSVEAGSVYTASGTTDAASVVYLKLGKQDDLYRGFYSRDGVLWQLVGQRQMAGLSPSQIGLSAANGDAPFATEIAADFEWLQVDELCGGVWLPVVLRGYAPVGRLLVNEVMPEPGAGGSEWVELLNVGPGPLNLRGHQVTDQDGHVYTIPDALPEVPSQGLVLIHFDGQGASGDDYDLGDNLAVLHSPDGLVDVFEDDGDQVAVYRGTPHSSDSIVAFVAYGLTPGEEAADAAQALLWGQYWFVPRRIGLGGEPVGGGPALPDYTIGLFPGSRVNLPRRWVVYTPETASPGVANGVPAMPWYNPSDGATVDAATLGVSWQSLDVAEAYHFQLDESADFNSPRVDEVVTTPWWRTDEPLPEGTYYWRVSVIAHGGREGPWLQPVEIVAQDLGGTVRAAGTAAENVLAVQRVQQRKDTDLLCLDGDHRHGVDDPWDEPHPPNDVRTHGCCNCCRASVAMINHYHGGDISQDYLAYMEYENWGNSFRWGTTGDPSIGRPSLDLGHASPSGTGSDKMAAWGWGLDLADVEIIHDKPVFDWIRQRIDQNRPMVRFDGVSHCTVIAGYKEDAAGTKSVYVVDPWAPPVTGEEGGWQVYDQAFSVGSLTVPPVNVPDPARDDPAMHVDSDGDGIQDWDEVNRFYTDPQDPDTDGDGIEDKVEIAAYVFDPDGTWNHKRAADCDGDSLRMERDADSDGDGFSDGCEDSNRNGIFEPGLFETSNFNDTMGTACPQLSVQPTTLDFGWSADTRTFGVVNLGGGGLSWEASSLPTWLSLSPESGITGPNAPAQVVATVERRGLSPGEHSDSFSVVSEYGTQQVAVHVSEDEDPPLLGSVSPTAPEPIWTDGCTGEHTIDVRADVNDPGASAERSGIDYVEITFARVGGQSRSGVPMEAVGTQYEGTLGPLPAGAYEYWLTAADNAGNVSESEPYDVIVNECDAPQIGELEARPSELYLAPCRDTQLTVRTWVRDATGLAGGVRLHYGSTITGSLEGHSVAMDPVGEDAYEATIGPFDTAGLLSFWVSAADAGGATAYAGPQTVNILACEVPTIGAVGQDVDEISMAPCQPDQFTVFADPVTDAEGVEDVELWLRAPGEAAWNSGLPMQRRSGTDRWELIVGPAFVAGTWEWKVVARNHIGGQSESDISTTNVLTCTAERPRFLDVRSEEQYVFLEPCTPNTTRIWADVEADFPLDQVNLLWGYGSDSGWWSVWWVVPMQFDAGTGEYGADVGPFDAAGSVQYIIEAVDTAGLSAISDGDILGVYECQPDGPDIRGTQLSSDVIYPEPCTPDALHVQARVVDEPGRTVTAVDLLYARGNSTAFQRVPMDPAGGDDYECTISGLTEPDVYRFYIEASNDVGGTSTSSTESFVVAACEIPGPTIEDVQIRETSIFESPCEPDDSEVRAWVSDPLGVSSVEICHRLKAHASAVWSCSPMTLTQGGWYEGEIGDLAPGAWMISVNAVNTYGVTAWSGPGILMVNRCQVQGPDITVADVDDAISVAPCRPSRAVVQAQLSDPYDIQAVTLVYRLDDEEWHAQAMTATAPGEYAAVLGDFDHGGTVTYLVTARNDQGGWAASEAAALEVNDCHFPTVGTPTESADPIYAPPCDDTGITIEAQLTDSAGIAGAWLAYRDTDPGRDAWTFVALQRRSGTDQWGADLGPFPAPAVYAYWIYALNNVGGGAWSTAGTFRVLSCAQPTIGEVTPSETPIYVAPCPPNTLALSAKITCEDGVGGAWIAYRAAGVPGARWYFAAMSETEEDIYAGQIGPFGQAMTLQYAIGARSAGGGWTWTAPAQIAVLECTRPAIEKVSSSETSIYALPCVPSETLITAPVSDPLGIAEVALRYRDRTEEPWTVVPMVEDGTSGVYEVTLGSFDKPGLKDYGVVAKNALGLWGASPLDTLTVSACDTRARE